MFCAPSRKPFEAKSFQELSTRVLSGRYTPLPETCCPDLAQVAPETL